MSWHVCVSGSSVGPSAGLVECSCMVPSSALGGILAFLLCAGLPSFVIKKSMSPTLFNIYIKKNWHPAGLELTTIAPSRTIVTDGNC